MYVDRIMINYNHILWGSGLELILGAFAGCTRRQDGQSFGRDCKKPTGLSAIKTPNCSEIVLAKHSSRFRSPSPSTVTFPYARNILERMLRNRRTNKQAEIKNYKNYKTKWLKFNAPVSTIFTSFVKPICLFYE